MTERPSPLPQSLRRVVDRYVRAFAPERIVLFGSYAKGTSHAGSDVDLLVVADVGDDRRGPRLRARHLAADCFPPVDVVFAAPEEVSAAAAAQNPFLLSILGYGILIYQRRPDHLLS
jgi:uncharacterized protein